MRIYLSAASGALARAHHAVRHPSLALLALSILLPALISGCAANSHLNLAVDGPERKDLLDGSRGTIALVPGRNDPPCITLTELSKQSRQCHYGQVVIEPVVRAQALRNGREILVLNHYVGALSDDWRNPNPATFNLVLRDVATKRETTISSWQQVPSMPGRFNKSFAVSPDETKVLVMQDDKNLRVGESFGRYAEGTLTLINLNDKSAKPLGVRALEGADIEWISSNEIAFTRLIPRDDLPPAIRAQTGRGSDESEQFGHEFKSLNMLPVAHIRNLADGTERAVHLGVGFTVSADQKQMLVRDDKNRMRLVDLGTGNAQSATLAGVTNRGVIGFVGANKVLYWSLPTEGREVRKTQFNSPLVGPKLMLSLKVGELNTSSFATVIPFIDPRARVTLAPR
jgi:hypothetical protein